MIDMLRNLRDQELVLKDTCDTPWRLPETFGGERLGVPTRQVGMYPQKYCLVIVTRSHF